MGLGLGYALSGLGQGLEQGIGQYLAQKRLETEQARQARIDAETAALHQATVQHYQAMDSAEGGRVAAALAAHGIVPSDTPDTPTPSVADALSAPDGPSMGGLPDVGATPPAPVYSIGGQSYQYDPARDPTQVRVKTVADEIAARQKLHDTPSGSVVYQAAHRPPPRASTASPHPLANAPGSVGALTHSVAADKAAVLDLKQTMDAARKNPPSGRAILRQNPQADTTGILNRFRADTTATRQQLDAARGRLQQHTAQLGAVAGGQHTPDNGTVNPSDGPRYIVQPDMDKAQVYEALRDQGMSHEDAINLIESEQP